MIRAYGRVSVWAVGLAALAAAGAGCGGGSQSASGGGGTTGAGGSGGGENPFAGYAAKALHVSGNKLVDTAGTTVRLLGVNRAGTEYMCVGTGSYVFDGPAGPSSINALKSWKMNAVRLPLNESCWLGVTGTSVTAEMYREDILAYVQRLHAAGMYVIFDLHWSAPTGSLATRQTTMPFGRALEFWTSVATAYKDDPMAIFDLFNEPILNANDPAGNGPVSNPWNCWRNGCSVSTGMTVGMQAMLSAVRATGATQVVVVNGIEWSHNMDGWMDNKPSDPMNNMIAGFHAYKRPLSTCDMPGCWNGSLATVAASYPVLVGELGQQQCATDFMTAFMDWADQKGLSYLGWAWNPQDCSEFPALITDWDGTPTTFGAALRTRLLQHNVNP